MYFNFNFLGLVFFFVGINDIYKYFRVKVNEIIVFREKLVDNKDFLKDLRKKIEMVEENVLNR